MNKKKGRGLGIAGFVLGLLSLVLSFIFFLALPMAVLAIIFTIIQIRRKSNGLAIAGLVLAILGLLISAAITFFIVVRIYKGLSFPSGLEKAIVIVKYNFKYVDPNGKIYKDSVGGSGVIFSDKNNLIRIFTNRHVVDCSYSNLCDQRISEKINIITNDGISYPISKVYISPHKLDVAILEINKTLENYSVVNISLDIKNNDLTIAIGYPAFASNAREFSKASGKISGFRSLINEDGFKFEAIDSTAYTYFGSSGGGLFDNEGNLIGLTTWIDKQRYSSFAISAKSFPEFGEYKFCYNSYYTEEGCAEYCSGVLSSDLKCIEPCDNFYCETSKINGNDTSCFDKSLVMGLDGQCRKPCGLANEYCQGELSYCYKNACVSCPPGYSLFKDGLCYK